MSGTGPNGRIVRVDVERAHQEKDPTRPETLQRNVDDADISGSIARPHEVILNTQMRRTIAKRLVEAKSQIPHFYLNIECQIDRLLELRSRINDEIAGAGQKISINDFIIKAVAAALRRVPDVNSTWTNDAILRYTDVDISVAVSIDGGLITPIVRQADRKGLSAISAEVADLAERARAGSLQPEKYQGGNFTISNLGMYGIPSFSAIINPPQSAILAVGQAQPRIVMENGSVGHNDVMHLVGRPQER